MALPWGILMHKGIENNSREYAVALELTAVNAHCMMASTGKESTEGDGRSIQMQNGRGDGGGDDDGGGGGGDVWEEEHDFSSLTMTE